MKKSIYLAAFAALALTACSNDTDSVFDQSAAERLEQYKKDYADVLTADGGLWSMEYFANPDEPGYVFVMKFDKNGSVEMSANHMWIGNSFKQETSLWKMIADNGPVLSFNSYNTLFHIFSDPANILGPNAPTGDSGDINETGYGHEGDYEFQVMQVSDDRNTVRLLGKKRMYDIFLHRLDPSTDVEQFLASSSKAGDFLSPFFDYVYLIADDGEEFIINDLNTSIPSVYPKLGDAVTQTRSANGIFTLSGFRFMSPLEVPRANGADHVVLKTFEFQPDGSLLSAEGHKIVGPYAYDVFMRKTMNYAWYFDTDACAGSVKAALTALVDGLKAAYPTRSLESVYIGHEVYNGEVTPCINIKLSGAKAASFYINYTEASEDGVCFELIGSNSQAATFEKKTKAMSDFVNALCGKNYTISSDDIMSPETITLSDKQDSNDKIVVKVG